MMAKNRLHEARWWETRDAQTVECLLCPWHCQIKRDGLGQCGVRTNHDGALYSLNYGQVTSLAIDPIEKKPLYHFHPGSHIVSVGSFGCNLHCKFCQNWQISQHHPDTEYLSPEGLVQHALEHQRTQDNIGIAYTYNEPTVFLEYVLDSAKLAAEVGLKNVLVSNGIIEPEPLQEALPYIDAVNVDVKAMDDAFYTRLCGGKAGPARRTVEMAIEHCHVEITNMLIPGENDSPDQIRELVDWASSVSPVMPIHFSAYRPAYKFNTPPTSPESLQVAYDIAIQKMSFVYVGNVYVDGTTDTYCPACGELAVSRSGLTARTGALLGGRCAACGTDLNIVQ